MGKRDEILDAAVRLFSNFGYHKTTMDQIASEAGVAKGTLYWHFSSKKELFLGMVQSDLEKYFDYLESLRDNQEQTSRQKVETLLEQRYNFFNHRQSIFKEVMNHQEGIDPEFKEQMFEIRSRHQELLVEIFSQGVERGEFAIADPYVAAIAFMGMNIAVTTQKELLLGDKKVQTIQALKDLIFHGMLKLKS